MLFQRGSRRFGHGQPPGGRYASWIVPDSRFFGLDVIALHTNCLHITRAQIDAAKQAGLRVVVYTENDPEHADLLFEWGVDTVITDRPDLFLL